MKKSVRLSKAISKELKRQEPKRKKRASALRQDFRASKPSVKDCLQAPRRKLRKSSHAQDAQPKNPSMKSRNCARKSKAALSIMFPKSERLCAASSTRKKAS